MSKDEEFEAKVKKILISLIESNELIIETTIESDYDGKFIQTSVTIGNEVIQTNKDRINDWGKPVDEYY